MKLLSHPRARRIKRHARRWAPCAVVAITLLATSQMLWTWQT